MANHLNCNTTVLDGRVHYKGVSGGEQPYPKIYTKHNTSKPEGSTTLLVMGISEQLSEGYCTD